MKACIIRGLFLLGLAKMIIKTYLEADYDHTYPLSKYHIVHLARVDNVWSDGTPLMVLCTSSHLYKAVQMFFDYSDNFGNGPADCQKCNKIYLEQRNKRPIPHPYRSEVYDEG
jgi:hypothetical protein